MCTEDALAWAFVNGTEKKQHGGQCVSFGVDYSTPIVHPTADASLTHGGFCLSLGFKKTFLTSVTDHFKVFQCYFKQMKIFIVILDIIT